MNYFNFALLSKTQISPYYKTGQQIRQVLI